MEHVVLSSEGDSATLAKGEDVAEVNLHSAEKWSRNATLRTTFIYTISSITLLVLTYMPFFLKKKSLFRITDGTEQHYLFFVYIGRWFRETLKNFFSGEGLHLTAWNLSLGYGTDMISSLAAYLGDPLNWLSVFTPTRFSEIVFNFTLLLRPFLAGIALLFYCKYRRLSTWASVVGALSYASCAVMLVLPIESFLVNPMIIFPLVIWGVDKIFDERKPAPFILSLSWMTITYFYFGFMTIIVIIPYCIIRFFMSETYVEATRKLRNFMRFAVSFTFYGACSMLISAVSLVPVLLVISSTSRLSLLRPLDLFYNASYYISIISGFAGFSYIGPDSYYGFGVLAFISLIVFLMKTKDKYSKLILMQLIVLTVFILFPFFGKLLNGWSYVANRWTWAFAFFIGMMIVDTLPELLLLNRRRRIVLFCSTGIYILFLYWSYEKYQIIQNKYVLICLAGVAILMLLGFVISRQLQCYRVLKSIVISVAVIAVFASSMINVWIFFGKMGTLSYQQDSGSALADLTTRDISQSVKDRVSSDSEKNMNWRYDVSAKGLRNTSLLQNLYSYDFYLSIYNNEIDKFHTELGIPGTDINMAYTKLGSDSYLEHLLGTKYVVIRDTDSTRIPFGYKQAGAVSPHGVKLYESDQYRPIASFFDRSISESSYEKLSMADKRLALVNGVILESGGEDYNIPSLQDNEVSVIRGSLRFSNGSGKLSDRGNDVIINSANTTMSFDISSSGGTATYIEIPKLSLKSQRGASLPFTLDFSLHDGKWMDTISGRVPETDHMAGGKDSWAVNLGLLPKGKNTVNVTFSTPGIYSSEQPRIRSLSLEPLITDYHRLEADGIGTDFSYSNDKIVCNTSLAHQKFLLITTPYSRGWKAQIDGNQAEVLKADTAFMVVKVPQGKHTVTLTYKTPGLTIGVLLTCLGLTLTVLLGWRQRKMQQAL